MQPYLDILNKKAIDALEISGRKRQFTLVPKSERENELRNVSGKLIEDAFHQICRARGVNLLIEIGAHDAYASRRFIKDQDKHAIAFEMNPEVHKRFFELNNIPRMKYVNMGLSNQIGSVTLYVPAHTPKSWSMESSLSKRDSYHEYLEQEILVSTLEKEIPKEQLQEHFAIWIDVEGSGSNVLKGAGDVLAMSKCKALYIEVQNTHLWQNEALDSEIVEYLKQYHFVPLLRDYPGVPLYNLLFVKENEINYLTEIETTFWEKMNSMRVKFFYRLPVKTYLARIARSTLKKLGLEESKLVRRLLIILGSRSAKDKI